MIVLAYRGPFEGRSGLIRSQGQEKGPQWFTLPKIFLFILLLM